MARKRQKRAGRSDLSPQKATPQQTNPANLAEQEHTTLIQTESSFSGPLPPPELFDQYDKVLPGAAERILKMTESEQEHRHSLVGAVLKGDRHYRLLGMTFAFLILLGAIGGSVYLISIDKDLMGSLIFIIALAGIVRQFIQGQSRDR